MGELGPKLDASVVARARELPLKPEPCTLTGRWVTIVPYDATTHNATLYGLFSGEPALGHPAYDADALVWRYMLGVLPKGGSREAFDTITATQRDAHDARKFVMTLASDGTAVGVISLMSNRPAHLSVEIGGIMITPRYQRTPVLTEAVYLLLRHLFELGYRRVEWKCNNYNARSKQAAQRLGFVPEGVFRSHMIVHGGHSRDTAWFSMIESEWPEKRKALECWLHSDAPLALFERRSREIAALNSGPSGTDAAPATV